jgi:ABC-2 type transport system ATP-binding protein
MELAIETAGLERRFGDIAAVDRIDLAVPERAVYGFLGRNGSGKTTTIRLLLGLLRPSAGSARIFGIDFRRRLAAARQIGALVETPFHYDHLTGSENLAITARLLGAPRTEIARVLDIVGLTGCERRLVRGFSLGMRQRLGIARALLGRPRLLVLDEPTNGLDPDGIREMRALVAGLPDREGVTVFVSSHLLSEIEQTATHVGLMEKGRLVSQGPLAEVRGGRKRVSIRAREPDRLVSLLAEAGLGAASDGHETVTLDGRSAAAAARDMPELNFLMVERGIHVLAIEVAEPSLEELFLAPRLDLAA